MGHMMSIDLRVIGCSSEISGSPYVFLEIRDSHYEMKPPV